MTALLRVKPDIEAGPPRVCVVTWSLPPEYGGAELAAFRYATHRNRAGGRTLLVGPAPRERVGADPLPDFVHAVSFEGPGHDARRWGGRAAAAGRYAAAARALWPTLYSLRREFDVVHIFNGAPLFNLMALPLARILGKPSVLDLSLMGSDDPLTVRRGRAPAGVTRRRPRLKYQLFRMADAVVSKSEPLRAACVEAGLLAERIATIPYSVDLETYRPADGADKTELRRALRLDPGAVIGLFVGGIHERKGVHVLLEAFRAVHARVPNAHLLVVGPVHKYDPAYVEALRQNSRRWGIDDRVTFIEGVATNVHDYMRASDVFLLPSQREGLPIAILEAMACGLAVIGSDIPEIATSQIRDGQTGLLFPVGDAAALAGVLERLAADAGERLRMGRAAHEHATNEFGNERVMARYDELYLRLLRNGRMPAWASSRADRSVSFESRAT